MSTIPEQSIAQQLDLIVERINEFKEDFKEFKKETKDDFKEIKQELKSTNDRITAEFKSTNEHLGKIELSQGKLEQKFEGQEKIVTELKDSQNKQIWALIVLAFTAVVSLVIGLGKFIFFPNP
jgi:predicted nuclease with TOPRIM domain